MNAFTKAPWELNHDKAERLNTSGLWQNTVYKDVSHVSDGKFKVIVCNTYARTPEESLANANLIAASPRLFEALVKLHDYIHEHNLIHSEYGLKLMTEAAESIKAANP